MTFWSRTNSRILKRFEITQLEILKNQKSKFFQILHETNHQELTEMASKNGLKIAVDNSGPVEYLKWDSPEHFVSDI